MSLVRIYVMYPAGSGTTWRVSVNGRDGHSFSDGLAALEAARKQARALEQMGYEVQVRQESVDGTWTLIRD